MATYGGGEHRPFQEPCDPWRVTCFPAAQQSTPYPVINCTVNVSIDKDVIERLADLVDRRLKEREVV